MVYVLWCGWGLPPEACCVATAAAHGDGVLVLVLALGVRVLIALGSVVGTWCGSATRAGSGAVSCSAGVGAGGASNRRATRGGGLLGGQPANRGSDYRARGTSGLVDQSRPVVAGGGCLRRRWF